MGSGGAAEIAIVGMGCRFPGGASTPAAYWELLKSAQDATCEVPHDRWSLRRFHDPDNKLAGKVVTRRGGFLRESIRGFDADFFGISPREAEPMDPQQRLLLEVAWEAFEDAGIVADTLRGSRTGVYVGGFTTDNLLHQLNGHNLEAISSHTAVSATLVMLSNRLSYMFDLKGPSMTVDTACSSSLVALHLAVQSLRAGDCTLALAGGVNLMFRPAYGIAMSKGGFLSPDGRCKSFDASGDGYGRGEGAGLLILKPLDAALRDGDRVHAVIVETGVNQDGRTDGITLPNLRSQVSLIEEVYERARIDRDMVGYVEAHGTGTKAGDAVELNALAQAIASRRSAGLAPLLVGSAKSNIGHLEAAAGVAGVIKTVLAIRHAVIPPSIHYRTPPDGVDIDALGLAVATDLQPWPESRPERIASINSFGYGGTNAHAVLRAAPATSRIDDGPTDRPWLLPLSARSERALAGQIRRLHQRLTGAPDLSLRDLGYTLARRRSHLPYRAAIMARSVKDAIVQLRDLANFEGGDLRLASTPARSGAPLAFVYTGMGSQSWGMGRGLVKGHPAAIKALHRCDDIWRALSGWSLGELFARSDGAAMTEPHFAQPANFAVQVMLTEIARSHGLHPDAVVGHSAGEMAAAWAAGSLSLEDALRVTWHRSRLQQLLDGQGRMLAVGLAPEEIPTDLLDELDIAARNGPAMTILSGPPQPVSEAARRLGEQGAFTSMLPVNIAYHSRQMEPLEGEFIEELGHIAAQTPEVPLYSTVTGAPIDAGEQDPVYWWRNLRDPVAFLPAIEAMIEDGFTLYQEVGPHPALASGIIDCLRMAGKAGSCLATLRRGTDDLAAAMDSLATSYVRGAAFDWKAQYPAGNLVTLLPYAWDRQDLWSETELSKADRLGLDEHPFVSRRVGEATAMWDGDFKRVDHHFLADHQVEGSPIFPAAGFVELALAARSDKSAAAAIEGLSIHRPLETFVTPVIRMHMDEESGGLAIFCRENRPDAPWAKAASARLVRAPVPVRYATVDLKAIRPRCPTPLDVPAFYDAAARLGIDYGSSFRCIEEGWLGTGECLVRLQLREEDQADAASYFLHPVLLDGGLQSVLALAFASVGGEATLSLPVGFDQLRFSASPGSRAWCHVRDAGSGFEIRLADEHGTTLAEMFGLRLKRADLRGQAGAGELLYHDEWRKVPPADRLGARAISCLLFADRGGVADALVTAGTREQIRFVTIPPHAGAVDPDGGSPDHDPGLDALDFASFDEIVYLPPLDLDDELSGSDEAVTGQDEMETLLFILHKIATVETGNPPSLTVCTAGAQSVTGRGGSAPGQNALWGALRAARIELPQVGIKLVDLASRLPFVGATQLVSELLAPRDEPEIAYREGQRHVSRIAPMPIDRYRDAPCGEEGFELGTFPRNGVARRCYVTAPEDKPGPGEVRLAVISTGIGEAQRIALAGLKSDEVPVFDQQCVGVVLACGEAVTQLRAGERVLAFVERSPVRSHVIISERQAIPLPAASKDENGAAFDWLAAHHALFGLARLEAGQWLLVDDGAQDAGLAAILLAQRLGARVIATAAGATDRDYLAGIGCKVVLDRSSLAFRDAVLKQTQSHGVDVILGRWTGEARRAALDCLRPGGTYVDASPFQATAQGSIPATYLSRAGALLRLDLADTLRRSPGQIRAALDMVLAPMVEDAPRFPVRLLPAARIDILHDAALRPRPGRTALSMSREGLRVLPARSTLTLDPAATYVVTGGFGGIGPAVLEWLATCGARSLAVISRSGAQSPDAQALVDRFGASGVRIWDAQADVGCRSQLVGALERLRREAGPIKGVIHGAGLLADAAIHAVDAGKIDRAMGAKARGALHLHRLLADDPLDFFMCHGSIAAAWGNAGQYAYAGANGFLAGLVRYRRSLGMPATCVNWGPIAGNGMAARDERLARYFDMLGMASLPETRMIEILQDAIVEDWPLCDAADIAWKKWHANLGAVERRRISELVGEDPAGPADAAEDFRKALAGRGRDERRAAVFEMLLDVVAPILKLPRSRIAPSSSLTQLGTDSLMAAEIAEGISGRAGIRPRIIFLVNAGSLLELAGALEAELHLR